MKPRDDLHSYWRDPPAENNPKKYIIKKSSPFLVDVFKEHIPLSYSILEVGCNVGRNLNALWQAGYRLLNGVDINPEAVHMMSAVYPSLGADVTVSPLESFPFGLYDVIYSMAVLCHIHPDSEGIFRRMAESAKIILTIEDEHGKGTRHHARNYEQVFSQLGFVQVAYWHKIDGMNRNYHARLMRKR